MWAKVQHHLLGPALPDWQHKRLVWTFLIYILLAHRGRGCWVMAFIIDVLNLVSRRDSPRSGALRRHHKLQAEERILYIHGGLYCLSSSKYSVLSLSRNMLYVARSASGGSVTAIYLGERDCVYTSSTCSLWSRRWNAMIYVR